MVASALLKSKAFRPPSAAGFISFGKRQKKRTKEKRFPDRAHSPSGCARDFPTRHPWLGRKTAGIHARRPTGLRTDGCLQFHKGAGPEKACTQRCCHFERSEKSPAINGRFLAALEMTGLVRSAFGNVSATFATGNPEGGGHGCPPFFATAWMPCRKIATAPQTPSSPCRGKPFSLVRFFWASKRNEPARRRRAEAFASIGHASAQTMGSPC